MKAREPFTALLLMSFLTLVWLGFLFHRDPRFAGSLTGGILAVLGSVLLLVPAAYSLIKRVPALKQWVTRKISFANLLTIHIYSGFIGAILVLLHTGHKFNGMVATALTAFLLIVVFSGYIGRYLLGRISKEVSEKKVLLSSLQNELGARLKTVETSPEEREVLELFSGFISRVVSPFFLGRNSKLSFPRTREVLVLSEAVADVEYALATHNLFKRAFSVWLKVHIVLSAFFYFLLFLHVLAVYFFGLRWFS